MTSIGDIRLVTAVKSTQKIPRESADSQLDYNWDEEQVGEAVANTGGPLLLYLVNLSHKVEDAVKQIPTIGQLALKILGFHTPTEWIYALTEGVEACFYDMTKHSKNKKSRCELTIPLYEPLGLPLPDLFKMPVVSLCWNYRKDCGSYGNGKFNW